MQIVGSEYLDPNILSALPNIEFIARRLVEGLFVGMHKSPHFGYSVEFKDHRDYVPGDDLRIVDWKVWARKDKYFVKRFEMESQLKATILLDCSRSMDFGENRLTKLQYASYLAASLAYLIIHQNDMAGLVTFDTDIHHYLPARGSRGHMRSILKAIGDVQPGPATNVPQVCNHLAQLIKSRGIIILISDLLDDVEETLHAVRHLQYKKHEVIVFHVLDDAELNLPYEALANFEDLESRQIQVVDPLAFRNEYQTRVKDYCEALRTGCQKTSVDYHLVSTSQPVEIFLANYLTFRARRSR